jgi:predicted dehydrogenase
MQSLGVAVIGAGAWGINHVRVLAAEPGFRLVWVCDPDDDARQRARVFSSGLKVTASVETVLADPDVSGVVIASPAATHAELACRALRAGKHVLVEKPLALSVADALRVAEMRRYAERTLVVGHLMVYHPALVQLRSIMASGELGKLRYLYSTRATVRG